MQPSQMKATGKTLDAAAKRLRLLSADSGADGFLDGFEAKPGSVESGTGAGARGTQETPVLSPTPSQASKHEDAPSSRDAPARRLSEKNLKDRNRPRVNTTISRTNYNWLVKQIESRDVSASVILDEALSALRSTR